MPDAMSDYEYREFGNIMAEFDEYLADFYEVDYDYEY